MDNLEKQNYQEEEQEELIACARGCDIAMNNLGFLYMTHKKDELAEEYLLKACAKDNAGAMCNLGYLYYTQQKYKLAEEYFLKACIKDNQVGMTNLKRIYINIELYNLLYKIENKSKLIKETMIELLKDRKVHCLNNKINLLQKISNCPVCLDENVIIIPTECAHYYCVDCYIEIDKCALCNF